jgi:hypothetical protein
MTPRLLIPSGPLIIKPRIWETGDTSPIFLGTEKGETMDTSSKECPFCKLVNPASAQVCDCGYKFTGNIPDPYQLRSLLEKRAKILISAGISSLSLGLALTILISLVASAIGFRVLFYGLILSGLVSLIMGIGAKIRIRKINS